MREKVGRMTLLAVFAAFSLAFMFLSSALPTGQMGFLAISSLFGIAAVCECGIWGGVLFYAVTAILGFLLIPDKSAVLVYALFFGYYPTVKALAERRRSQIAEWAIKLLIFNAALSVMLFLLSLTVFDVLRIIKSRILLFAVCNIVFLLFDIGVSRLISFYIARIHGRFRRGTDK